MGGGRAHLQQLLAAVQPAVTPDMNAMLTAEFTMKDIKGALDTIGDLKVPSRMGCRLYFSRSTRILLVSS